MILEDMTDSALAQLVRYASVKVEAGRDRLELAVSKNDLPQAYLAQGSIEELRHLGAAAKSILRGREKERGNG